MYHDAIFILKAAFQQDIIEIVVRVVGADDLVVVAGRRGYRALAGVNDGSGGGKQGGGGDHFSALAEKFATAIVLIHGPSFFFVLYLLSRAQDGCRSPRVALRVSTLGW